MIVDDGDDPDWGTNYNVAEHHPKALNASGGVAATMTNASSRTLRAAARPRWRS
jgi:hypothetical protein